ncbi:MAG: class II D-tagatose-bisphosphate aldolase, non-catalytic subunit [Bacteroidales bacterium]|nr:class II D-tagatose-bisphosphate aldolase, non-catalytic subunit [Bacteroidales bacterium]
MGNQIIPAGTPSYCTANELAIEGVLKQAKRFSDKVLIEATSNQVNQYGGYTGMLPEDYRNYVWGIADRIGFPREKIILAGDHLGPQPFQNLPEAEAMPKACEMVRMYAAAGYTKIHLDTSMRLADDDRSQPLSDRTIARRGAELLKVAEEAWEKLHSQNPQALHPVYIIGSEVPIPGGAQVQEEMQVTDPDAFSATVKAYEEVFSEYGLSDKWKYVIAVVVQPGVEFGDADVHMYNRTDAKSLCAKLKDYPELMFEGHSTDYQSPQALRQMVEDGVGILKVGPALTFAAREALFALSHIEDELIDNPSQRSNYIQTVEQVMLEDPKNWQKYYHGTPKEQALKRAYSYSDRSRYYMPDARIEAAMQKLFTNLEGADIPMGLLHQYMPLQYVEVRDGRLTLSPRALVLDAVRVVCDDYNYATRK